ncbi:hypothetical protein [Virgibacillus sp. Bac330]|uniref:tubby C-terminal domain-like protein n=1 Tax=Virgibacillus sp. Bac330 TaxID=2419841 RepID=UPI000EF4EBF5|nr:hypothetical protein [Virgibacillus sp. Bac330]
MPFTIDQEEVGYIRKTAANTLEKDRVFTYTSYDEEKYYVLGIKKNGWKRLVLTEYQLQTNSKKYHFKDKLGSNILYFCVMGEVENHQILIEESWAGDLKIKFNHNKVAKIKVASLSLKTTFQYEDTVEENSPLFALTILMYFMFKIYKDENKWIEGLLE